MSLRLGILTVAVMAALSACDQSRPLEGDAQQDGISLEAADPGDAPEVEPNGTVIDIYMYTVDPDDRSRLHVFKPELVSAKVGDTIRFIPAQPSHQSSSIATMLPENARGWEGDINEEISYVLPQPGVYGYQCIPHYAAGMVGVVVVEGAGMLANLEYSMQARHPGLGNPKFVELFAEAERRGMFDPAPVAPEPSQSGEAVVPEPTQP